MSDRLSDQMSVFQQMIDILESDRGHADRVVEEYDRLLGRGRLPERAMRIALIQFIETMQWEILEAVE